MKSVWQKVKFNNWKLTSNMDDELFYETNNYVKLKFL